MIQKFTNLLLSAVTLSSFSLIINHSIAMEIINEKEEKIDFSSCLANPEKALFTKSIDKLIGSKDIQRDFLQYTQSDSFHSLPHKNALLGLYKLLKLEDHNTIEMNESLFDIFSKALEPYSENPVWAHCMAYCLEKGIDTNKDPEKAIDLYKIGCLGDFSWSFNQVAGMYKYGIVVEKNSNEALRFYEEAIRLGNTHAMVELGKMYKNGLVKKDINKCFELFNKAARLGNTDGMIGLGLLYQRGVLGTDNCLEKAFELFNKAAQLGNADAFNFLSTMYKFGTYVEKDLQKSLELIKESAELGSPSAMNMLALMYKNGQDVEQNFYKAKQLLQKAVELKSLDAMYNLALMYKEGQGVEQDLNKSIKLLEEAVQLGHIDAMNTLACMYKEGKGVEKNLEKAFKLYKKVANLGNLDAMNNLAIMHEEGEGTSKDVNKAIDLMNTLALIYKEGKGANQNFEKAFELYKKAANLGSADAMYDLAIMYAGETNKDLNKSVELLEKAFFLKSKKAKAFFPMYLKRMKKYSRLIAIEFKYPDLLPECSISFIQIIRENKEMVKINIELVIQKEYKKLLNFLLSPNSNHPLKNKMKITENNLKIRNEISLRNSQTFSYAKEDYLRTIPSRLFLDMIRDLSPRSLLALSSTSKHFHFILKGRMTQIKIILEELDRLKSAFIKKLENAKIETTMVNIGKIMDILSLSDPKTFTENQLEKK